MTSFLRILKSKLHLRLRTTRSFATGFLSFWSMTQESPFWRTIRLTSIFVSNLPEVWVVGKGSAWPLFGSLGRYPKHWARSFCRRFLFAVVLGIFQLLPSKGTVGLHALPPPEIKHFVHLVHKINVLISHGPCFPKLPLIPCSHHFRHLFPSCVSEIIAIDVMLGVDHLIFRVCVWGGGGGRGRWLFIFLTWLWICKNNK